MAPDVRPGLTLRQQEVLATITELTERRGYPPTIREIGVALGMASPSSVHRHVCALEQAGLLSRSKGRPRVRIIEVASKHHEEVI